MSLTTAFMALTQERFRLDWQGIHGVRHWSRVRLNGLRLAAVTGADARIVEYFAFLHDVCRENDGRDALHGPRAAEFARSIRAAHIDLDDRAFSLLIDAIHGHTHATGHKDITVLTCWDADRLDLVRMGIVPDPERLFTAEGRRQAQALTVGA